jgi:hypothetical protein
MFLKHSTHVLYKAAKKECFGSSVYLPLYRGERFRINTKRCILKNIFFTPFYASVAILKEKKSCNTCIHWNGDCPTSYGQGKLTSQEPPSVDKIFKHFIYQMITSTVYHYICLSILILGLISIPFAQYWCFIWRNYKPLNGRPFFFAVWFNTIVAVLLSVCIAFTFVILYDYPTYTASLVSFRIMRRTGFSLIF